MKLWNGANCMLQILQTEPKQRKAPGETTQFPLLESNEALQKIMERHFNNP